MSKVSGRPNKHLAYYIYRQIHPKYQILAQGLKQYV